MMSKSTVHIVIVNHFYEFVLFVAVLVLCSFFKSRTKLCT